MMIDVFKTDAFSFTELVSAINKLPYVPTRIGNMGLFVPKGIYTLSAAFEENNGVLTLVPTQPRGAPPVNKDIQKRKIRDFRTVHLPQQVTVMADEVQGIRSFGSETDTKTAMSLLMEKAAVARRDLDLTHEFQRVGALKGLVVDADGTSVLYNYFTEFGVVQQSLNMELTTAGTKVRSKCTTLGRMIEDELGGQMFGGLHAFCSPSFFDALVDHPNVVETFLGMNDARELRRGARMTFEFGDVVWEEYRGGTGLAPFIPAGQAFAFPTGVPDMFQTLFSPAPYTDTVNTLGLPFYMKGKEMDYGKGMQYELQSNPLHINTRPRAVIKLGLDAAATAA